MPFHCKGMASLRHAWLMACGCVLRAAGGDARGTPQGQGAGLHAVQPDAGVARGPAGAGRVQVPHHDRLDAHLRAHGGARPRGLSSPQLPGPASIMGPISERREVRGRGASSGARFFSPQLPEPASILGLRVHGHACEREEGVLSLDTYA